MRQEVIIQEKADGFLLAVLTLPGIITGEASYLEDLLEAGVTKLHIRKPEAKAGELAALLDRLAPRWASRLVLHGSRELAERYAIPQVHGSVDLRSGQGRSGGGPFVGAAKTGSGSNTAPLAISTSVHSWEELRALPDGLAYAFISPLFDSISKRGYQADNSLLLRPEGAVPCRPVGLGGIGADTIGEMIGRGWTGAAVLGWIWDEPKESLRRYEQLKKVINDTLFTG